MTASYYLWKRADNDLPGPPDEVHAALLCGDRHPAIQPFDPSELIAVLEMGASSSLMKGEEWRLIYAPLFDVSDQDNFDHWRLVDQARLAALPVEMDTFKGEILHHQEPDLVSFPAVVEAFEAFIRGEPPPHLSHWRNVNSEI